MFVPSLLAVMLLHAPADSIVDKAKAALAPLTDSVALRAAGYAPLGFGKVRDLTPFQGQHWFHLRRLVENEPVDLSEPTFVMYVPVHDTLQAVGVAYARRQRLDDPVPEVLAGTRATWHAHVFCRNIPGEGAALADGADDCTARGGTVAAMGRGRGALGGAMAVPQQIVMVHAWTVPNPDGPYAHDNPVLPFIATGLAAPKKPTRDDRQFAIALGETYGARPPMAIRIEFEAAKDGMDAVLWPHREAMKKLVPELLDAESAHDTARHDALRKKMISEWNALHSAYVALAKTPEIKDQLDAELAQLLGDMGHMHH
ncbi:MAG: hypothetical protein HYR75_07755 [Gemmatimonadetes bacterium]|nr:hypothetical protein [Gemmatimonadota bacterium]MBI3504431.1 hypothetical protein [Pseudomonadota bacterium]